MQRRSPQCGFTLVEMLIALVLALIVGGVIIALLNRQQRLYRGLMDIMDVRTRVHDASDILVADLRSTSVMGDTIRLAADTAIELFSAIGASTLCSTPSGAWLTLPPDTLANGNTLTAWLSVPDTGDEVLIFHDSTARSPIREWERFRVLDVRRASVVLACPPSSGFTTAADVAAGASGYVVTLSAPPSTAIRAGAPVRFVRRGRYSVYRASDGLWYLGYRRCDPAGAGCEIVQPVSGPYDGSGALPIAFRYYRSDGSELMVSGPTTDVVRVDIIARARSTAVLQIPGFPRASFSDSGVASVAFRNR